MSAARCGRGVAWEEFACKHSATAIFLAVAFSLAFVVPAAAAKPPKSDGQYCYEVSFASDIPVPPPGQVAMQQLVLGDDCRLHADAVVFIDASAIPPADANASTIIDSTSEAAADLAVTTIYSYRAYAVSRVWDAANLLLTEYWTENPWTSTGAMGTIAGWGGVDGGKWHREWPGWTGWYPDTSSHYLGLVAGGIGYTYEELKGRQGFGYQGVLDPSGTYFYNRLTNWITGNRNGAWSCTQEVYLKKVPLPPLSWSIQRWCGSGVYPYK